MKTNTTGFLDHDFFSEEVFAPLASGLARQVEVDAWVHLPDGKKGSCKLVIRGALKSNGQGSSIMDFLETESLKRTDDGQEILASLRATSLITKTLYSKTWVLFGHLKDTEKQICIIVLPGILATYSFKLDAEKWVNPQLN